MAIRNPETKQLKTLKQLCVPRRSVFDRARRDVVLDLTDLLEDKIDATSFFEENYLTDGMKRLLREAFRRFEAKSPQGVFVLTQAMGGGKTHNMVALGLLAKHPEVRQAVMGDMYESKTLGKVRVVAFTGRESDAPYGIWGAIAEQLGKKELFKDYYSPLSAPGQSAWVNLLKGEPVLILLDELPPYFEDAKSKPIGNSDLSRVTTTALSNLLVAVGKDELSNVCVVISDLKATYEGGSQAITKALEDLKAEVGRGAMTLEPVGMNTDEIYHILRKRLFENLPDENAVWEIARAYAQAVRDAKQMDITNASPEKFASQLKESYPFHFSIRDLYARFRENPGFQQTRGLIRLMRVVTSRLFDPAGGKADKTYLVHPYDLDLNDRETLAEITQINPSLDNAISHDIASNGQAIAEIIDANLGGTDAQDSAKLLLVASLANIPDAVVGLSISEIVSYLCSPERDVSKLPKDILGVLSTKAWYLHSSRDGKLYFKNVQNLVAKLKTTAESYNRESCLKELRTFLESIFQPTLKDCYQDISALPAVDEIQIKPDRVSLIISEPNLGGGLSPALQKFYDDLDCKNRVLFLTGARGTLEVLLETASELKAITHILKEMDAEKVSDNDPQRIAATNMHDSIRLRLLSAARETFTTLFYPHGDGLMTADFVMTFTDNSYKGEKQIRETLKAKQKFTDDVSSDSFRKKCEERLFTQKVMPWTEIKKRAAMNTRWQWHRTDALDLLKDDLVSKDQWRENDGYVEKPPFPKPQTSVLYQEMHRDDDTGLTTLKLSPVYGDTIYYEIGKGVTTGSQKVADPRHFQTSELEVSFLCLDSTGEHQTGEPVLWRNKITVKSRVFQDGDSKKIELKAAPAAPIKYTSDGSDPKLTGGLYDAPALVPTGTVCVLAVAEKGGVYSEVHRREIDWSAKDGFKLAPDQPVTWKRRHEQQTTKESYEFLATLKKHQASAFGTRVSIVGQNWVELTFDEKLPLDAEKLESIIGNLRGLLADGQVAIDSTALYFPTGQQLLDWIAEAKTELKPKEVVQ
ncbi:MAG TPA: DUF499 domain-containing protein [Candidatus Obscuribacterales bacterium]